ncbi:MAG TPA: hypothetical protein PKX78_02415 [Candidatus Woesebacteria bacterium]|nr:hypothetical protein [Candidatus Woesebacteria bacterium]
MKLENSIILTLTYSAQFGQALTEDSLYQRLIDVKTTPTTLNRVLNVLVLNNIVIKHKDLLTLRGYKHLIAQTHERKGETNKYWSEARNLAKLIQKIPWAVGAAVTGSVAVNNAKNNDDLDFMIITASNRMWLTRLILNLYSLAINKRKPRGQPLQPGWCFNLWLSTSQLEIPTSKRSLYTAFELIQAAWLLGSAQLLDDFWQANLWVKQYLPQAQLNRTYLIEPENQPGYQQSHKQGFVYFYLMSVLEKIVYFIQYIYMSSHRTNELVETHQAFFHPINTKKRIYFKWRKIVQVWQKKYLI